MDSLKPLSILVILACLVGGITSKVIGPVTERVEAAFVMVERIKKLPRPPWPKLPQPPWPF